MTGVKEKGLRGTNQWLIEVERGCRKGWGGKEGVQKGLMKEGIRRSMPGGALNTCLGRWCSRGRGVQRGSWKKEQR